MSEQPKERPWFQFSLAMAIVMMFVASGLMCADLASSPAQWHLVGKGGLANVEVERVLYEKEGEDDFLLRVLVTNMTDRVIGLDLSDFWKIIYPNQVGFVREKQRGDIDERRVIHRPLTDEQKAKSIADFKANALVSIPAHASTDYYRKFNAGKSVALARKGDGKFLFISLAGEQLVTDGIKVEQMSCEWEKTGCRGKDGIDTELFIPTPLQWREVPAGAKVIPDR